VRQVRPQLTHAQNRTTTVAAAQICLQAQPALDLLVTALPCWHCLQICQCQQKISNLVSADNSLVLLQDTVSTGLSAAMQMYPLLNSMTVSEHQMLGFALPQ